MLKDDHATNEPFTRHLHLHNDCFSNRMAKIGIKNHHSLILVTHLIVGHLYLLLLIKQ